MSPEQAELTMQDVDTRTDIFDSLDALRKAAAIRFAPELRDEAIACLALPDLKLQRRLDVKTGVFDRGLDRYAALTANSGNISIRRVKDNQEISVLPSPPGTVFAIGAFSRQGRYLPVLGYDHFLHVWELEHRAVVLSVPCGDRAVCADVQPDDRRLAVAATNAEISIYELPTGKKVNTFSSPFVADCVRYAPSGGQVAISSYSDPRVAIMDPNSGALLKTLTNGLGSGRLAWHPRDGVLAVPGHGDDLIYLWDTSAGRLLHLFKGHQSNPSDVEFSRDGDILISSGWDGMHLWNARAGEHLMSYNMLYGEHQSFSPDGGTFGHSRYRWEAPELFSFASGRVARRWHASEEDILFKVIAFSPDGRLLAFGAGGWVKLFEARTGDLAATLATGKTAGLCFQKTGAGLLVSGERGLFRWPILASEASGEFSIGPPEPVGRAGAWQQAGISEDGQVFAAFHGDHVYFRS